MAVPGSGQATITWGAVTGATAYDVLRTTTTGTAYATVAASTSATTFTDTPLVNGTPYYYAIRSRNTAGVSPLSPDVSVTPTTGITGITISGTASYEDKLYDLYYGMTGKTAYKPVRYAELELINANGGASLLATATTATGYYSINATAYAGQTVYVRVISTAVPSGTQSLEVKDLAGTPALYAVASMNLTLSNNSAPAVNIAVPTSSAAGGAFNILDVYTSGFHFVNSLVSVPSPTLALTAYWQPGNTIGTWFCNIYDATDCPKGAGIYVLSDAAGMQDTDEFDDDVLWHEFGHFVLNDFSQDDSPGGTHYIDANDEDLRLSWSEGWGGFFPTAVKSWVVTSGTTSLSADPNATPTSQYVDMYSTGDAAISINIASPESSLDPVTLTYYCDNTNNYCKYAANEVAVANVLWHLMSGPTTSFGMQPIWDAISTFPTATVTVAPVNLEAFWDQFKHLRGTSFTSEQADIEGYYGNRLINYREDAYEAGSGDDTPANAVPVSLPASTVRYLFKADGSADIDYVSFTGVAGTSYTVSTTAKDTLKNGADTTIRVIRETGMAPIVQNDNYDIASYENCDAMGNCPLNGDVYNYSTYPPQWESEAPLSSKVIFTAPASETYYVEIKTTPSPTRPLSAGRYGTYTLTITSP